MTNEQMLAKIAELEAQLAAKHKAPRVTFKVSAKGALSVYGLGRFPVTLYAPQWAKLLNMGPAILEFAEANKSLLSQAKPETPKQAPSIVDSNGRTVAGSLGK